MKRNIFAALIAALVVNLFAAGPAAAAYSGPCATTQFFGDNTWRARNANDGTAPWVNQVFGYITRYDYSVCSYNWWDPPWQSGSGAWLSIISGTGGGDIIQIGFMKLHVAPAGQHMEVDKLQWFYAWGVDGDPFKMPWPRKLHNGTAPSGTALFNQTLKSDGGWHWEFWVNGHCYMCFLDDSFRTWPRRYVQVAAENWNVGDQLGGTPSNRQHFYGLQWGTAGGPWHFGDLGAVFSAGHCYPWARTQTIDDSAWKVWTVDSTHSGC